MKKIEDSLKSLGSHSPAPDMEQLAERLATDPSVAVAYAEFDSPVGKLLGAVTKKGLITLAYEDGSGDEILDRLARRVSPNIVRAPARLDVVRRELDEYFAGDRKRFEIDIDWSLSSGFTRKILRAATRVPYGSLVTYTDIASEGRQREGKPGSRQRTRQQ